MKQYYNYTVHKEGIVVSHYTNKPVSVQVHKKNKQGNKVIYPRVRIQKDKKSYWVALHRLVAEMFLPNPEKYPHINHKDGNRLNNHVDNLEWCTHEMNIKHAMDNDLNPRGERHGIAVATEQTVRDIRRMRDEGVPYTEMVKIFGLKESTIGAIGRNQNWKHVI
ncbi:MAG: HNH endonuclease [Bacteroidales bacterium]